jgi:hypothetical protein
VSIVRAISAALILAWAPLAHAFPFQVELSPQYPKHDTSFESGLANAYSFVVQKIPDQEDRIKCPITIQFRDLKGKHLGFTPFDQPQCQSVILLDNSLAGQWTAQVVVAHELTHLLRYQSNKDEEIWLSEGLATLIEFEYIGVWPQNLQNQLSALSEVTLSSNPDDYVIGGPGYEVSYFFVRYLYHHFGGDEFIRTLATQKNSGWDNIQSSIRKTADKQLHFVSPRLVTPRTLWTYFAIALLSNDESYAESNLFLLNDNYTALIKSQPSPKLLKGTTERKNPWTIRYRTSLLKLKLKPLPQGNTYLFIADFARDTHLLKLEELRSLPSTLSEKQILILISYEE